MSTRDMATIDQDRRSIPDAHTDLCASSACGPTQQCNPASGDCVQCLEDTDCDANIPCNKDTLMCRCPEFQVMAQGECRLVTGSPCGPMKNRCVDGTACVAVEVGDMSAQSYCLLSSGESLSCMAPWPEKLELPSTPGKYYCSVDIEVFSPEVVRNLGRACGEDDDCGGLGGVCINTQCTYECSSEGARGDNCANGCDEGFCKVL
jgi:hypothetical protein